MLYLKTPRDQTHPDTPVLLYCELDENRMEVRKVEIFRSGLPGYASSKDCRGSTRLGSEPISPLTDIASDPEFNPAEIAAEEFENLWRLVTGNDGHLAILSVSDPSDIVTENGAYHLAQVSDWEPNGHISEVQVVLAQSVRQNGAEKDRFRASVRQLGSPFLAGESVPANFMSEFLPDPKGGGCDCDSLMMFVGGLEILSMPGEQP
jgi:Domain of unknown function (DUF6881)